MSAAPTQKLLVDKVNNYEVVHAFPKGSTLFQRVSGAMGATFFFPWCT